MAKKPKLTLQQEEERRKIKKTNPIVWWAYNVLAHIVAAPYHAKIEMVDDIRKEPGPCFLIWNHLSRRDYLFLQLGIYPRQFNMLAGYNEFFRKKFRLLFHLVNVIPKKNFASDMVSIAGMHRAIKLGNVVTFSPEGTSSMFGMSQPIVPGTGKFLKHYGIPIYCMDLKGAYLMSHKVDIHDKPGKIYAKIYKLFSPEDLKAMSGDEIQDKINEVFNHDDYVWNKTARIKYKIKKMACSHWDDMLYKCPKCGEEFSIVAEGNSCRCTKCGNGMNVNEYYDLLPFDDTCVIPETPSKWVDWERAEIIKEIRKDPNYVFERKVQLGYLPPYKTVKDPNTTEICGEGILRIDHEGLHYKGTKLGETFEIFEDYKEVYTMNVENDFKTFAIFYNGELFEFYRPDGSDHFGAKAIMLVQEMHRLHVNTWKNFPWNDWMYKQAEE